MPGSSRLPIFIIASLLIHIAVLLLLRGLHEESVPKRPEAIAVSVMIKPEPAVIEKNTAPPAPKIAQPEPVPKPAPRPQSDPKPEPLPENPSPAESPSTETAAEAEQQPAETGTASGNAQAADEPAPAVQENPFADLMRMINEAKAASYPLIARKRGYQGRVVVRISLDESGNLLDVSLSEGCDYDILNEAALELIKRVLSSPYRHNTGSEVILKMPVTYRLRQADGYD